MITKSGIDTKNFEFASAGEVSPELYMSYTANIPTGLFVLRNSNGAEVCITNVGARIVSILVPDNSNQYRDVVLGYDSLKAYVCHENGLCNCHGALIGRYANRISNAQFEINGKTYKLPMNNGTNCLHGGDYNWSYQTFEVIESNDSFLKLKLHAPHGEMGFPGTIDFFVEYALTDTNALEINYKAITSETTFLNVTNHSYFNLNTDHSKTILNHDLFINSKSFTPLNEDNCPTGEIFDIEKGGPFDFYGASLFGVKYFAEGRSISENIDADDPQIKLGNGYDHNFIIQSPDETYKNKLPFYKETLPIACKVFCKETGICMEVYTDQPGVQLYDSVDLTGKQIGKNNIPISSNCGICLETQHFADSPHHPDFPSTILNPGEKFETNTVFQFSII